MVLESADGMFSSVYPMFFGGNALEANLIFWKSVLQIQRALFVQDM